jgi:hypothetical protein
MTGFVVLSTDVFFSKENNTWQTTNNKDIQMDTMSAPLISNMNILYFNLYV